ILGYAALLSLLRFVDSGDSVWCGAVLWAVVAIAVSILVCEYGVAVAAAGMALVAGLHLRRGAVAQRTRALQTMLVAGVSTTVSYLLFVRLASFANRPSVSPLHAAGVV